LGQFEVLSFVRRGGDIQHDPQPMKARGRRPRLGFALGAGAARGWTHIGILRECEAQGLVPDVIVGTSIGAVVGGSYAAGKLAAIESFACSLTRRTMFSLMDISFNGGGLLGGNRLRKRLEQEFAGMAIEQLPVRFGAIATEIGTGHEIWLTKGPLADSLRASYALPGIFEPVQLNGRWLFDGAMVNPVPVTVCRALGADIVIAVNLAETLGRGTVIHDSQDVSLQELAPEVVADEASVRPPGTIAGMLAGLGAPGVILRRQVARPSNGGPGILAVMVDAFNIVQDRIARSRLAGDPPDVMITPRLGKLGLFDFHRADEMMGIGREALRRSLHDINELVPAGQRNGT
jgi:NTE family protein